MPVDDPDLAAAVLANYEAQRRAMVAGDADALGPLLAENFTLVHMTATGSRRPSGWPTSARAP